MTFSRVMLVEAVFPPVSDESQFEINYYLLHNNKLIQSKGSKCIELYEDDCMKNKQKKDCEQLWM